MNTSLIFQLFGGFIFSVIGFYLLKNAKKRANIKWVFIGLAMLIYCYFIYDPWAVWGIGLGLCGLAYFTRFG